MEQPSTTNTTNYEADLSNASRTLMYATGTAGTSGDNTLIAAPGAGKQLKIVKLQLQNESSTATVNIVKFGTVAKWRIKAAADSVQLSAPIPDGEEWAVGANLALVLNLGGANSHGYNVQYYVEG